MTAPRPAEEPVARLRELIEEVVVAPGWREQLREAAAVVERERDEARASEAAYLRLANIAAAGRDRETMRAKAAEARLAAARTWLARIEPYPERNGDHFRELREILTADAPVQPQPEPHRCPVPGYVQHPASACPAWRVPVSPQSTEETP